MSDVLGGGYDAPAGSKTLFREFTEDGVTFAARAVTLAPSDETTGAALVITTEHHEVHEGEMFHAGRTVASLANGGNMDLLLTTGTKECHTVFEVFAGGQVTVSLYEGPTVADGTAVPVYNMKRSSANTALATVKHTPTVTDVGEVALVNGRILPGGTSPTTRVGGGIRQGIEWVLAPETDYLLRVNNSSGGAIAVNAGLEWYEE